jgi:FKBP-type peptidyl-prolyl cis-trans isomerase SlyD
VKKGDFIKLDYTGRTEDGRIFDTTLEATAKEAGLRAQGIKYGPVVVKLGEGQLVQGLDSALEGAELGKHTIKLKPEVAFGKKDAKLLRMVPARVLKENKITPFVGQELDLDGNRGVVRVASPGRTIVDFNHPLAGLNVQYDVDIKEIVKDKVEITKGMMELLRVKYTSVEEKEGKVIIKMPETGPEQFQTFLKTELERLTEAKIELQKQ